MRFPTFSRALVCLTIGVVSVSACTQPADLVPVATISLLPGLDSIEIGGSYNGWIVTLQDGQGNTLTGRTLRWTSSRPGIATVDANSGQVTAVASGTTLITASVDGKSAQAAINVMVPVLSIVATPDSFDLPLTTSRTINVALVGPEGTAITNRAVLWSSSNPGIAVVSASGLVTAVSVGTVTITIRAGLKEKTVRVRVVGEPVASVRISPNQSVHVLRLGQTYQLGAQCLNAAQQVLPGRTISWNSSNPVVATVSTSGLVTGQSLGTVNITATCDNVNASVTVQVTPVPVVSVTISPGELELVDNTQGQLLVTARDSANNVLSLQGRNVVWTSDNQPVATVSATGVVSASNPGTANVQVSVDGVVSQAVKITVTKVPVATVGITPQGLTLTVNTQGQLTATARDVAGNILSLEGRTVVWSSSNQTVAQVSPTGVVTAMAQGTAQVTVSVDDVSSIAVTITVNP